MSGQQWGHFDFVNTGIMVTCFPDNPRMAWMKVWVWDPEQEEERKAVLFTGCFPGGWIEIKDGTSGGWNGPWYEYSVATEDTGNALDKNERQINAIRQG